MPTIRGCKTLNIDRGLNRELIDEAEKRGITKKRLVEKFIEKGLSLGEKTDQPSARDCRTLPPAEEQERRKLHGEGLNDADMGRHRGVSSEAIGAWRRRRELLQNPQRHKHNFSKRLELYNQGLNDAEIGKRCSPSVCSGTIRSWRRARGLPPTHPNFSPNFSISHLSAVSRVSEPTIRSNVRLLLGELDPQRVVDIVRDMDILGG